MLQIIEHLRIRRIVVYNEEYLRNCGGERRFDPGKARTQERRLVAHGYNDGGRPWGMTRVTRMAGNHVPLPLEIVAKIPQAFRCSAVAEMS